MVQLTCTMVTVIDRKKSNALVSLLFILLLLNFFRSYGCPTAVLASEALISAICWHQKESKENLGMKDWNSDNSNLHLHTSTKQTCSSERAKPFAESNNCEAMEKMLNVSPPQKMQKSERGL